MNKEKKLGPTGKFPRGKISDDDEGQLKYGVATDRENNVIILEFGKPLAWLGLDKSAAIQLANVLLTKATELKDEKE